MNTFSQKKNGSGICLLAILALTACSSPEELSQQHLQSGKDYMANGELDKALIEFKAANEDGKHALAYYNMALLDEKQHNPAAMRENLHSCLMLDDGNVNAKLKLAQVELGFGNLPEAMKQIDGVLIAHSDNITAQLLKADILLRQSKYPAANSIIDSVLAAQPENAEALTEKAEYYFLINETDKALASSSLALAKAPDYMPLHQLRIRIFATNRNADGVIAEFRELVRLEPENQHFRIRLAAFLVATHKIQDAEASLQDMADHFPNRIDPKLVLLQFLNSHEPDKVIPLFDQWLNNPKVSVAQILELCKWLISNERLEPAESALQHIANTEKDSNLRLLAETRLAEIAFIKNQIADAETGTDHILKENSDFIEASFLKARLLLVQNKADDAIKLLNSLIWTKDKSGDIYTYLGMAYTQKNDPVQADKSFKQALELNPASKAAFFPVYYNYIRQNQRENARQMLDKALKLRPHLDWLLATKTQLDIQDKNWVDAKNTLQVLAMFTRNHVETAYLNANILQGAGQYAEAIAAYQQILERAPNHVDAMLNLTRCNEALKSRDKAVAFLEAHHQKYPDNIATVQILGDLYAANKEFGKLKKLVTDQLQSTPNAPALYITLTKLAAYEHKKPEELRDILLNGLNHNPDNINLSIGLASWYEKAGDHPKVIEIYQHLHEVHPESQLVANNLASILLNAADEVEIAKGIELAEQFKDSKDPDFIDTYAWSLIKSGQPDKAVPLLRALLDKLPEQTESHYHLGMAYINDAKKNQAVRELRLAVDESNQKRQNFPGKQQAEQLLKDFEPATNK